jgi:hypothetical protein
LGGTKKPIFYSAFIRRNFYFSIFNFRFLISSEIEVREQQIQQVEKNDQQQKRIYELTKKVCHWISLD